MLDKPFGWAFIGAMNCGSCASRDASQLERSKPVSSRPWASVSLLAETSIVRDPFPRGVGAQGCCGTGTPGALRPSTRQSRGSSRKPGSLFRTLERFKELDGKVPLDKPRRRRLDQPLLSVARAASLNRLLDRAHVWCLVQRCRKPVTDLSRPAGISDPHPYAPCEILRMLLSSDALTHDPIAYRRSESQVFREAHLHPAGRSRAPAGRSLRA